jgi:hypothetical protein
MAPSSQTPGRHGVNSADPEQGSWLKAAWMVRETEQIPAQSAFFVSAFSWRRR